MLSCWLVFVSVPPVVVRNDEVTWEDLYHYLYEENAFDNIVISPGPGTPTCPADIGWNHSTFRLSLLYLLLVHFRNCWEMVCFWSLWSGLMV